MNFIKQPISSRTLNDMLKAMDSGNRPAKTSAAENFVASTAALMLGIAQQALTNGGRPLPPMMLVRSGEELALYDALPLYRQGMDDAKLTEELKAFLSEQKADAYFIYSEAALAIKHVVTDADPSTEEAEEIADKIAQQIADGGGVEAFGLTSRDVVRMQGELKNELHFMAFVDIVEADTGREIKVTGSMPPMVTKTTGNRHCILSDVHTVH